jgi:hypothetical protein
MIVCTFAYQGETPSFHTQTRCSYSGNIAIFGKFARAIGRLDHLKRAKFT